jgi:hypothetical protein
MRTFIKLIENKLWSIVSRWSRPKFAEFTAKPSDEFRSLYQGRIAEIFFENKEKIVHKWLHYLPIYEQLLSPYIGSSVNLLEIGVSKGGSLRLWRRFLGDRAVIFGIDIDPACALHDGDSGFVRIGSQDDPEFLRGVVREMNSLDVVLDDGSHVASHQRASINVLFPLLSEGGLYIIEDLETAYWAHFEGGLKRRGTVIELLKGKVDETHRHYRVAGLNTIETMPDIESIQFFDSIAVVRKRKQLPRYTVMVPPQDDHVRENP